MYRRFAFVCLLAVLATLLAGANIRATGAGLACSGWPACNGGWDLVGGLIDGGGGADAKQVSTQPAIQAQMLYRVSLAVSALLAALLWLSSFLHSRNRIQAVFLGTLFLASVLAQIFLAVLTVTLKLNPVVVTGQVLVELLAVCVAFWIFLRCDSTVDYIHRKSGLRWLVRLSLVAVLIVAASGAWTNANYAGFVCPDFPTCKGAWWPSVDLLSAFDLPARYDLNYAGGVLSHDARVAINWLHRIASLFLFLILGALAISSSSDTFERAVRRGGMVISILLFAQIGIGVAVVFKGPGTPYILAHAMVGALLLLAVEYLNFRTSRAQLEEDFPAIETEPEPGEMKDAGTSVAVEEPLSAVVPEAEPVNLFKRLTSQLHRTRSGLAEAVLSLSIGRKSIDSELLEEIEASLLMADIGMEATTEIIEQLKSRINRDQIDDPQALSSLLQTVLLDILQPCDQPLQIESSGETFVILVVGVNGVGKTTTIGKLARRLQEQGLSVMLAAGDTFRAAAVEQLQTWGERNQIAVVAQHTGADSASVIYDAFQSAKARSVDVLIADTAGRLHTKDNLMEELRKVKRIAGKLDPAAPHEVLLVLDAGTGQNALAQARQFNDTVGLTGIALTKLDGTAKGGVIFALARQFGIPIRFIGIGEGIDDLQDFNAEDFVNALFDSRT